MRALDRTSAHPHQSGTPTLHKLHMHHTVACDPSLAGAVSVPRYCRAWGHLAAAWYCAVCEWSLSSIGRAAALHKWGDALPRFGSERAFAGAQGVQGAAGEDAVFGACRRRQPHSDATGFATLCDGHRIGCALRREDVGAFGVVPRVGIAVWAEAAHDCCMGLGVAGATGPTGAAGTAGIGAVLTSFVLPGEPALPAVRFLGLCCLWFVVDTLRAAVGRVAVPWLRG